MKKSAFNKPLIIAAGLVAILAIFLFVFLQPNPLVTTETAGTATPAALDGTLSKLHFESSEEGDRIKALDICINEFTTGWKAVGYEEKGNFYEKSWCTGAGSDSKCMLSEANAHEKNQHTITLYTLHYNDPVFFGEGFSVLKVPEQGWSSSFNFDENGKTVVGEGFNFIFEYVNNSGQQYSVFFGSSNYYAVYEKKVFYTSNLPLREDVNGYLKSAESMRDKALAQFDELSNSVQEYINSLSAVRCEYGPYLGNGIPPVCTERPLNESEKQEQSEAAQNYFNGKKKLLDNNYAEMYNSLMTAFPFGKCWK